MNQGGRHVCSCSRRRSVRTRRRPPRRGFRPVPGPGQVLVDVSHVSLNYGDLNDARSGRVPVGAVLGSDAAGVVVRAAADGTGRRWAPGGGPDRGGVRRARRDRCGAACRGAQGLGPGEGGRPSGRRSGRTALAAGRRARAGQEGVGHRRLPAASAGSPSSWRRGRVPT
ncbi:alcohol dehydrogenase catalytic domain-containing protein [Streptomyces stelliscabiei]|uniref:alcohol dehydrogenase catalytic domain-containing protein n=1 Tax=Streptomyces stelliscabiei TaxID=146820 RepID=UPI003A9420E4